MKFLLLMVTSAVILGCDGVSYDLDSVTFGGRDIGSSALDAATDLGSDMLVEPTDDGVDTPDFDMESRDVAPDAADADADADVGVPSNCEIAQPLDPDRCNPTRTGECPGNGFCTLAVAAAPPPELLCVMRDLEGTGVTGTPCTRVSDCMEGLTCVDWGLNEADPRPKGCARFCEIETGVGCDPGEFCTTAASQPPLDGIGVCTPSCDPYDTNACPSGQTCNVDYNYPVGTCEPQFRCVLVEDSLAEGEECGPARMVASCAEDLICYQVDVADFRCVVPCQSDSECGGRTCQPPAGDWQLRFCEAP